MVERPLGSTGAMVSAIGFGAFKIGRNVGIKYERGYKLPDERAVAALLNGVLDLGINLIDTAPAYGVSEDLIGRTLSHRRDQFFLATKVGETFERERSIFDFSANAVRQSVERSRSRLRADVIDLVSVHSDGNDLDIIRRCESIDALLDLQAQGVIKWIGFSGKTVEGAKAALPFVDVLMVEYHLNNRSHEDVIADANTAGKGVLVKKGLDSGRLGAEESIRFVLANQGVSSMVIGSLSLDNMQRNLAIAGSV